MPTSAPTLSLDREMSLMASTHYNLLLNAEKDAVASRKDSTAFVPPNGLYVLLRPETNANTLHL
jgi:hypothetical protein